MKTFKFILLFLTCIVILTSILIAFLYVGIIFVPEKQEVSINAQNIASDTLKIDSIDIKKELLLLKKSIGKIDKQIDGLVPKSFYILINTTNNVFCIYNHTKLVRKGRCSTGTYTKLTYNDDKEWIFKTPKGKFNIIGKIADPVWIKPDWAFVEEGLPIPPKNDPSRYESGVLGDYAIAIGEGYYIHGTLYKRFLGLPVTHGCIRLNDEDLEAVYKTVDVGSRVYIF
jgi:lipoprotein-anchoring transpeptidase ErfK/SrfK